jgi:tetratricopeptide (TPR) repeat protein
MASMGHGEHGSWRTVKHGTTRRLATRVGRRYSRIRVNLWQRLEDPTGAVYTSRLVQTAPRNRHPHAIMAEFIARTAPTNSPFHLAQLEFHSRKAIEACSERGLLPRAEYLFAAGRNDEALDTMKTASGSMHGAYADFWVRWAQMLTASGRLDEADAVFNEALRLEQVPGN